MPILTGTPGDDFIQGTSGDDVIEGLGGNDALNGRDGNDDVRGGDGDDALRGDAGNDILTGGDGVDYILGGAGNDVIDGDAGNDYLEGGAGIDALRGGAGDDELSTDLFAPNEAGELYDGGDGSDFLNFVANFSSIGIVFSIANPAADQIVDGVTIRNFEGVHFTASDGDDSLTGAVTGNDVLYGRGGNDLIQGLGGNDLLQGDDGNDDLRGGDGDDHLWGVNGIDTLDGGAGNDQLDGDGQDLVYGGAGDDSLRSGPGAGALADGGDGIDFLTFYVSNDNADIVFSLANPSVDQVVGGTTIRNIERADFTASDGNDTLTGGAYADTFLGGFGNDVIHGGGGNDSLKGESGTDQLFGDDGDDALTYEGADTLLDGGAGVDLATINGFSGGTAVVLDVSDPSVEQNVAGTIIRSIERLHYTGGDAGNQITGGNYVDFIAGGTGVDVLNGGGGNDTVSGGQGVDQLSGGAGDDFLHSFESANIAGDSLLDGGDGFDLLELSIQSYTGGTTIDLAATSGRIRNIEQINFSGGSGSNIVTGGGAADSIRSGNSADELRGLGGDDTIFAGGGSDLVYGGDGDDWLEGGGGGDTIYGEAGDDDLDIFGGGNNFLDGGTGNDELVAGFGADTLIGGEGNDYLDGGDGVDTMTGGVGNDIYVIDTLDDVINELAGEGIDEVRTRLASYTLGDVFENLRGNSLTSAPDSGQILAGNAVDNVITGSQGNDTLIGGAGADTMSGLLGNDTYHVDNAGDVVIEFEGEGWGRDVVYSTVDYTLAAGQEIEVLSASNHAGTAPLNLTGNALGQEIWGNAGANNLRGGGGTDFLLGQGGNDTYFVDSSNAYVFENAGGGSRDVVYASVNYTLLAGQSVEVLSASNHAATTALSLTGNELGQEIWGNAGANNLRGGGGADFLLGQGGNDTYFVDTASAYVFESVGNGRDVVYASVNYTLLAGQSVEVLSASSHAATTALNLTGNELGQEIWGNAGANSLRGGGGTDFLLGQGGNDTYFVDVAGVQVYENAGGGQDVIYASVNYSLLAGQSVEVLSTSNHAATTALDMTGNELVQELWGNAGANTLDGKLGNDALIGQGGADTFAFTTALGPNNVDFIADFVAGTDRIALDDAIFTGLAPGALSASAFVVGTSAQDADDRIIYNSATGQLYFDADGNGAGAAVQFATLNGHPVIAASDFTVI